MTQLYKFCYSFAVVEIPHLDNTVRCTVAENETEARKIILRELVNEYPSKTVSINNKPLEKKAV